jgi:hypothetical protein
MTAEQAAALHLHMQAIQPVLPTPEKKWYDRVVDNILGDDPCKSFLLTSQVWADNKPKHHNPNTHWSVASVFDTMAWLAENTNGSVCVCLFSSVVQNKVIIADPYRMDLSQYVYPSEEN